MHEFKTAIQESVYQNPENVICPAKFIQFICKKCISNVNNEEYGNGPLGIVINDHLLCNPIAANANVLSDYEILTLKTILEETEDNTNSDLNQHCVVCNELYRKNVLFKYEHHQQEEEPGFHYASCFTCEQETGDLHDASKCAYCRKPSRKKFPEFLMEENRYIAMTRMYDGSSLAFSISSFLMAILSTCISNIDQFDAFGKEITTGMFAIKDFNAITWWYLFVVSLMFVYQGRKSVSLLFDYRGFAFLFLPFFNGTIAAFDSNIASILSVGTLLSIMGQVLTTKKNLIISKRLNNYLADFPHKNCSRSPNFGQYNITTRLKDIGLNVLLYTYLWGTVAIRATNDELCSFDGEYFVYHQGNHSTLFQKLCNLLDNFFTPRVFMVVIILYPIGLFLEKLIWNVNNKVYFFTYVQGLWVLFSRLIMNLNHGFEIYFIMVNMCISTVYYIYLIINDIVCCLPWIIRCLRPRRIQVNQNNPNINQNNPIINQNIQNNPNINQNNNINIEMEQF